MKSSKPGELLIVIVEQGYGHIAHAKGSGAKMFLDHNWNRNLIEFEDLIPVSNKLPGIYRVTFDFWNKGEDGYQESTTNVKWTLIAKYDKRQMSIKLLPENDRC